MANREVTNPQEKGEARDPASRCQVCGATGQTVYVPDRPPPNRFCLRCVVEYGHVVDGDDDY